MPRRQNSFCDRAELELEDGRILYVYFTGVDYGSGHPENYCEQSFELDGEPISREDLPAEVTTEIIEKLSFDAKPYDADDY